MKTIKECGGFKGHVSLICYKEDGSVKWKFKGFNKMTNASLAVISGLLGNTGTQVAFTYLAVGSGTTAEGNDVPSEFSFTEPKPLELIPNLIPA